LAENKKGIGVRWYFDRFSTFSDLELILILT